MGTNDLYWRTVQPFTGPLFYGTPVLLRPSEFVLEVRASRSFRKWIILLAILILVSGVCFLLGGFIFGKWDKWFVSFLTSALLPLLMLYLSWNSRRLRFDRQRGVMTAFRTGKPSEVRDLSHLKSVEIIDWRWSNHQLNLAFDDTDGSAMVVFRCVSRKTRNKALKIGEQIAEFLNLPLVQRVFECQKGVWKEAEQPS